MSVTATNSSSWFLWNQRCDIFTLRQTDEGYFSSFKQFTSLTIAEISDLQGPFFQPSSAILTILQSFYYANFMRNVGKSSFRGRVNNWETINFLGKSVFQCIPDNVNFKEHLFQKYELRLQSFKLLSVFMNKGNAS